MDAKMRSCSVCRKKYRYCPHCREYESLPTWMFTFCSENCKDIYSVTSSFEDGRLSATDAKKQLNKLDISQKGNFGESYQNSIAKIMKVKDVEKAITESNVRETKEKIQIKKNKGIVIKSDTKSENNVE